VIAECVRTSKPVPAEYMSPLLLPGVDWLLDFFWEVSTDRRLGFGCVGLIPRASIVDELDRQGITDPADRDHIRRCIRQADTAYVRYMHRTATSSGAPGSSASTLDEFASPPPDAPKLSTNIFDAIFGGAAAVKQQAKVVRERADRRRGKPQGGGE
jgi:hypothetical protein